MHQPSRAEPDHPAAAMVAAFTSNQALNSAAKKSPKQPFAKPF
jgi:hypothetical protein